MKNIRNSQELHREIQRIRIVDRVQDEALMKRMKEIETSLQPANLLKNGVQNLFKKNDSGTSLIPVLVGAGVQAGLQRLIDKKLTPANLVGGAFAGNIMSLVSGLVNTDQLTEKIKSFFSKKDPGETTNETDGSREETSTDKAIRKI